MSEYFINHEFTWSFIFLISVEALQEKWHSSDIFSSEDPLFVTLNIYSPLSNLPSPLRYVRIRMNFPGIHIYCNVLSQGCFVWDLSGLIMVLRSQIESFHNNKQGS